MAAETLEQERDALRELLARFYASYHQMWGGDQFYVMMEEIEERLGITRAAHARIEDDAPEYYFTDAFGRIEALARRK